MIYYREANEFALLDSGNNSNEKEALTLIQKIAPLLGMCGQPPHTPLQLFALFCKGHPRKLAFESLLPLSNLIPTTAECLCSHLWSMQQHTPTMYNSHLGYRSLSHSLTHQEVTNKTIPITQSDITRKRSDVRSLIQSLAKKA